MDSGNGPVKEYRPGWAVLYVNARVPSELKYLINYYKNVAKLPSFNWAVRQLLETHPALAKLASELYTQGKITDGLDPSPPTNDSGDSLSDRGSAIVAGLFLGHLCSR